MDECKTAVMKVWSRIDFSINKTSLFFNVVKIIRDVMIKQCPYAIKTIFFVKQELVQLSSLRNPQFIKVDLSFQNVVTSITNLNIYENNNLSIFILKIEISKQTIQ